MNQQKAQQIYQFNNNVFSDADHNQFNSKKQFERYGLWNTINTIWSKLPKFFNENNEETHIFNKSSYLLSYQALESLLYQKGIAALKKDFFTAEVIDYIEICDELLYLKAKLNFVSLSYSFEVIEEWSYDSNNKIKFNYVITNKSSNQNLSNDDIEDILINRFKYNARLEPAIPYTIFSNNFSQQPDLAIVDPEFFKTLDNNLYVLQNDAFLNSPWFFTSANKSISDQINQGFKNIKKRVITLSALNSFMDTNPIQMLQGQSQSQSIIQSIDKTIALIKKFSFMKNDSSDFGTKNMHNVEAEQINSDFEDYIEQKSNLRELQLLEFMNKFWPNEHIAKIIITGSSEWLKEQAKIAQVNQNGVMLSKQNQFILTGDENNGNNED